jgi:hypothetical protein
MTRARNAVTHHPSELGEAIFAPVIRGTIAQAAALPDAALAVVAEFLAAHRALLDRYLDTAPAAGEVTGTVTDDRPPASG